MRHGKLGLILLAIAAVVVVLAPAASGAKGHGATAAEPQVISDDQLTASSTTIGGADVLPTTRTIAHWWGSTLDPNNGVTYGYNMVGADPNTCSGSACDVTIEADITPIAVNVGGLTFDGNRILAATLGSPQFANNNISWWAAQIQNLETTADPTHLAVYLTDSVLLHIGQNIFNCCVIGFHGTRAAGAGGGSNNSNGNAKVQTFAWASWVKPGIYARPNGGLYWALQDIHALSHEIAEWADDPFVNNYVEPWLTPTAPQYGCTGILETGDTVVGIGFAMGTNTTAQGPNPNGTQSADGYYHPEDEVFLPWFLRVAPNTISEPTQNPSTNIGRYTLMGDLNPFPGFRQPATGC